MSMRQFANSLSIIQRNEHTNRAAALVRHLLWQARKLGSPWPIRRRLSRSVLMDDEPGGVIGLVNMLGLYDFNNMNFVQQVLGQGGVFVDVGANIGAYTLIASENAATTVISLEPNPTAFRKLERNVALNMRRNVIPVNRAASSRAGALCMTNNGADPTNRILAEGDAAARTIMVEVDMLDAICRAHGAMPTLIKIDVEGHEPQVLEGAAECLEASIACIVENGDRRSVIDIMQMRGMRGPFYYRHRLGCLQTNPQPLAEDAVFIGPRFEAVLPNIRVGAG